ncbi:hypothetical protein FGO68_gene17275 [Halteria grandinella]|uniref:Profilin n=1 Tax=Halteria grandinella TaxID=5974 RepID=A0A8J8SZD9_HALGN|nr:hypothetical protein FGO68_gene17275 [Halteria grandinella]
MSGWDAYLHQITNKFDHATNQYTLTNVCEFAAIYGHDGNAWATSPGFALYNYEFDLTQEDGSKKKVPVSEFKACFEATKGNRKGSEAGIRIANQKYMFIKHNPENNSVYLAREGGGGACIIKTGQTIVIGVWNKAASMSNGQLQNAGDCNELVEAMGKYLIQSGY